MEDLKLVEKVTAYPTSETSWKSQYFDFISLCRVDKTIRAYIQDLERFEDWFKRENGQDFKPELMTRVDVRAFRRYELDIEKVAPATWNRRRASLSVLSQWATLSGRLNYDPMEDIQPAEEQEKPPRWLEKAEFYRFLRQVELSVNSANTSKRRWLAIRDQAMIALMVYAGLREEEVTLLDLDDIQIGERKGLVVVRHGKGDKRRDVPLNAEARRAVSDWLAVRGSANMDKLFIGVSTRLVQRVVKEVGRQAGVEVSPHDLRHTFAKRMLDAGVPLTVVSKLLGHSRLETTARYVQPGRQDFEDAVERI